MKLCDAFYAFFSPLLKNHLNKNDEIKKNQEEIYKYGRKENNWGC